MELIARQGRERRPLDGDRAGTAFTDTTSPMWVNTLPDWYYGSDVTIVNATYSRSDGCGVASRLALLAKLAR